MDTAANPAPGAERAPLPRAEVPDVPMPVRRDATGASLENPAMGEEGADPMRHLVGGAHEGVDRLAEAIGPHVKEIHSQLQGMGQALDVDIDEWVGLARQSVRDHPLGAIAAAAALGLLLARLSR